MMKRPFLDDWIARCCGLEVLSEESLRRYQLNKINEVLRYTERNSLLYRKRLAGVFERHGEAIRAGMWIFSPTASACWCVPAIRCSFYCPERNAPMGLRICSSGHCPGSEPGASPEIPRLNRLAFAGNWNCIARTVWSPRRDSCAVFWVRIRPPREFGPFCRARNLCRKIWKKRLSTAGIVRFSITTASLRQATAAGSSAAGNRDTICVKAICFSKSSIRFPVSLCPTGRRVKWSSPH